MDRGDVIWGLSKCERRECDRDAEAWLDGWGYLCIPCVDEALERQRAVAMNGRMRELIRPWEDG